MLFRSDGQSPLARIPSFVNCACPKCGGPAKRETDTMPQWAGSSWYFLRFCDPHNDKAFADRKEIDYWMPVDWYNGGMEHVTRHLLYSRFWHHFLYDIGEVNTPEPYAKRSYQGLVLGSDGDKMSKSKGNVIDPLDIAKQYGADTLRLYVLFMGDYMAAAPWSDDSVKGCRRFLERIWRMQDMLLPEERIRPGMETPVNAMIKKVTEDYERMKYNTAIAAMMSFVNDVYADGHVTRGELKALLLCLSPVAPHIAEEIWEACGFGKPVYAQKWPAYDPEKLVAKEVEIAVQIKGKLRARILVPADLTQADGEKLLQNETVKALIEGKEVRKVIFVPGRLLNIVC